MKILLSIFVFVGIFASCEQLANEQQLENEQQVTREQLDQQFATIEALIAEGTCDDREQCSFLPYGSKACGGPQGYLIFSSNIDTEELQKLVDRYSKAEAAYNTQHGIMSDCSIPPEPKKLECRNGDCVRVE